MYHPTTRVLTVLELLQAYPQISGAELARRLEVDRRTVRRYIVMLQDLGIPVEAARGPYGGYRLRPGFKLPPLMFSDDEALAVTLSLIAARRSSLVVDPGVLEGALAKIERVLPADLRARLQAVQVAVDFSPRPAGPQPAGEVVMLISTAAQQTRRVRLRYRSPAEETLRSVDPYGLVHHWERWYIAGWCHLRQGLRIFRLDRVIAAELEEATFVRPAGFNSLQYVLESLATMPWGWPVEVLVEASLADVQLRVPPGSALFEETPGGVILRAHTERLDQLARLLLTLERPFVVRRPPELRDALRQLAVEVAALAERAAL